MELIKKEHLSKRALYLQVYDLLADRISKGILSEGTYLPNEYDLSRELDVSIGTIRKAVDLLSEAQLVIRQQGKGTIVSDRRWSDAHDKVNRIRFGQDASIAPWHYTRLSYDIIPAEEKVASILKMDPLDSVHRIHDLRKCPPNSKIVDTLYVPVAIISDMSIHDRDFPTIIDLARENKIVIGHVEERVSAVLACEPTAGVLSVGNGSPLLKKVRIIYTDNAVPLEYRVSYISTDDGYYWSRTS